MRTGWDGAAARVGVGLCLLLAAVLGGCATAPSEATTPPPATVSSLAAPDPDRSRVIVYLDPEEIKTLKESEPYAFSVTLDGTPMGTLRPGGFVTRDVPAGSRKFTAEGVGYPGVSRRSVRVAAGRTYYFSVSRTARAKSIAAGGKAAGFAGALVAHAVTSGSTAGPVEFTARDEVIARPALADATLITE